MLANPTASFTLLAVDAPLRWGTYTTGDPLTVSWVVAGAPASSFQVLIDGVVVVAATTGGTGHTVTVSLPAHGVTAGDHTVTVACTGCKTLFPLSHTQWDGAALATGVPAAATIPITVVASPPAAPPVVQSAPVGFASLTSVPPYEYGPTILLEYGVYHAWYCR